MSRHRLRLDGRIVTEAQFAGMVETMHNEIATILATAFISEDGYVCQPVDDEPRGMSCSRCGKMPAEHPLPGQVRPPDTCDNYECSCWVWFGDCHC